MLIKQVELSLSKEERRIVDEHGNVASTWARIGFTADLVEGDDPADCIQELRGIIQPEVDDWLLAQGGFVPPPGAAEMYEEVFGDEPGDDVNLDDIPE